MTPSRLVEWFEHVDDWSTARKTMLLSAIALGAHVFVGLASAFALRGYTGVDRSGFVVLFVLLSGLALGIPLAWSAMALRSGREGLWAPYVLVITYGLWITVFVQGMGSWSTPAFAFYPLAVVLVALYFGERVGWWAFGYGLVCLGVREILERSGAIDYAPLLVSRSIDEQDDARWVFANSLVIMAVFTFCFVIGILVVATRRRQDERLHQAHLELGESAEKIRHSNDLIARYAPREVAQRILAGTHPEDLAPERVKLTIFFSDIVGFTDSSDQMDPEGLAEFLNEYLALMSDIAERHGATINQFVGDGIMIFIGAPDPTNDRDHAIRAVRMAQEMQQSMPTLNAAWIERGGRRAFKVRIGINTGYASVGDFGSPGRKTYSAIGIQMNLAARIEAECTPGKILVSDTTWALVREHFDGQDLGERKFKGLHFPVNVFEIGV